MPSNNELRVFISSTFRDLQEEREHLVKKIFPEIRALCRERGIRFTEVDLRWGLTDEDVVLGQVVRTCLEEIDGCRPYFIGITGERYGYAPELAEYYKDAELLKRYPWIQTAAMEGSSIIDLEFRHAVLNDSNVPGEANDSAFFFFRRHRRGVAFAIVNRGAVLAARGERAEALPCFRQAADEYRDIGDRAGLSYALHGFASALVDVADAGETTAPPPSFLQSFVFEVEPSSWRAATLGVARQHAEECVEISKDLSMQDTLFGGRVLLSRMAAAEGDAEGATEAMRALLVECDNDEQRAELHYRMWQLGSNDEDHRAESLQLYRSLVATVPKRDYQQRIDEMEAQTDPNSPQPDDATA